MKNKKMSNKVSLLKDCFLSMESFDSKTEKDEMIISVRNKISHFGLTVMTGLMFLLGILGDIFDLKLYSQYISLIIGAVNYGMLIAYCKKGVVKNLSAWTSFLWSIITLPMAINNAFLDKFVTGMAYVIASPILIAAVVIILYVICNVIYKKAQADM